METKQIIEVAHENKSSGMAREYFTKKGLSFEDLGDTDMWKLQDFINHECKVLLADKSYSMIKDLKVSRVKQDKYGWHLITSGSYFKLREGISFWNPKTNDDSITIGFCGWASGCNRIPFIVGFIKWCDWMANKEDSWYCKQCEKEMSTDEKGVCFDGEGYCSNKCIEDRKSEL